MWCSTWCFSVTIIQHNTVQLLSFDDFVRFWRWSHTFVANRLSQDCPLSINLFVLFFDILRAVSKVDAANKAKKDARFPYFFRLLLSVWNKLLFVSACACKRTVMFIRLEDRLNVETERPEYCNRDPMVGFKVLDIAFMWFIAYCDLCIMIKILMDWLTFRVSLGKCQSCAAGTT